MSTPTEIGYTFDNASPQAGDQMRTLEAFLDPISARRLTRPVLVPGASCWEVGAGGGSIARLMARAAGPDGRVVATDIDPQHLVPAANLEVRRHDIRTEPAPGTTFDVIHARLLLLHLPERQRVLRKLTDALAPGGWLVVEEFDCTTPLRVLTAVDDDAAKLFTQVMETILHVLQGHGANLSWAQDVHAEMVRAGLTDVDSVTHSESWTGGSRGLALHDINSRQLEPELVAAGLSPAQLRAFHELTRDPSFAAMSYQFVSTRGRRPGMRKIAD
ncbi:class I SAM-dependent methyltransferase [Plantactinospora sp. GCM10030261]|uniref:class I SAM-dependent methyltransferase n=1 Tax=Plantactinospora sp. GCM10030261 TaxID=3273420 RepID=UPI00361D2917